MHLVYILIVLSFQRIIQLPATATSTATAEKIINSFYKKKKKTSGDTLQTCQPDTFVS